MLQADQMNSSTSFDGKLKVRISLCCNLQDRAYFFLISIERDIFTVIMYCINFSMEKILTKKYLKIFPRKEINRKASSIF
jgi:hypothetical protein